MGRHRLHREHGLSVWMGVLKKAAKRKIEVFRDGGC